MTLIWFVVWLIANNEPLALDPVNAWAATLILAAALDFARPDSFKPRGGDGARARAPRTPAARGAGRTGTGA